MNVSKVPHPFTHRMLRIFSSGKIFLAGLLIFIVQLGYNLLHGFHGLPLYHSALLFGIIGFASATSQVLGLTLGQTAGDVGKAVVCALSILFFIAILVIMHYFIPEQQHTGLTLTIAALSGFMFITVGDKVLQRRKKRGAVDNRWAED